MLHRAKLAGYALADFLTGRRGISRRINGEDIRFPARWSRYYEADYERETFAFLHEHLRGGGTAIDVGGHIGLFATVMARIVGPNGRVITFEPTDSIRAVLADTVGRNGVAAWVDVRGEAVSGTSGYLSFFESSVEGFNANSLVPGDGLKEKRVATTTLDDTARRLNRRIDLVKIDAEGAELDVLRGGLDVLKGMRPAISLALHPNTLQAAGGSLEEIWSLLASCEMAVKYDSRLVDAAWFCRMTDLFDVRVTPR